MADGQSTQGGARVRLRPWTPKTVLVAEGAYRFTRNPLLAAVYLVVVHYTAVVPEEAYRDGKFGDSYRQYKHKVRRYL
ncbi:MAG TPA: hypothetical protein VGH63_09755 [Polyangia bacterium]|jgi:protein-S-isoprenylcysteine O-methyltransferase Ste14